MNAITGINTELALEKVNEATKNEKYKYYFHLKNK